MSKTVVFATGKVGVRSSGYKVTVDDSGRVQESSSWPDGQTLKDSYQLWPMDLEEATLMPRQDPPRVQILVRNYVCFSSGGGSPKSRRALKSYHFQVPLVVLEYLCSRPFGPHLPAHLKRPSQSAAA